jgi:hypothetical protein
VVSVVGYLCCLHGLLLLLCHHRVGLQTVDKGKECVEEGLPGQFSKLFCERLFRHILCALFRPNALTEIAR